MSSKKTSTLLFAVALFLVAANFRAPLVALAPLVGMIQKATGASATEIGMIGTITPLAFASASPLAPKITKRIGIENTVMLGMFLAGVGCLLRALFVSVYSIMIGTFLLAYGISTSMVPVSAAIRRDQSHRIQKMTSFQMFSTSIIGATAAAISVPLAQAFGWQVALGVWIIAAVPAIFAWRQIRKNSVAASGVPERVASDVNVLKSPLAWKISFYFAVQSVIFFTLTVWMPTIIQTKGYSVTEAGNYFIIFQLIALPTVPCVAKIAEVCNKMEYLVSGAAVITTIGLLGLLWGSPSLMWLWTAIVGIGCVASINLNLMLFAMRAANPGQSAALAGMALTFGFLVSSIGPVLIGWLRETTGGWNVPFIVLSVDGFVTILLGWFAGRPGKL